MATSYNQPKPVSINVLQVVALKMAEQEQVGIASINAFVVMYGGKSSDNLTKLMFVTILAFLQNLLPVFIFPNLAEVRKQKFIPAKIYN